MRASVRGVPMNASWLSAKVGILQGQS